MKFRPPRRPDMLGWRTGGVGTAQQHCQTKRGLSSASSQPLHYRSKRRAIVVTKLACYSGMLLLLYATYYHLQVGPSWPEDASASSLWIRWGEPDDAPKTRSGSGTRTSTEEDANTSGSTDDGDDDDDDDDDNDIDPATYYFPKWPDDVVNGGVSVRALVGAMRACALGYSGYTMAALPVCSKIYIVDNHTRLWSSALLYENGTTTNRRVDQTEPFLRNALLWTASSTTTTTRHNHYPRLHRALAAGSGGFGFMVNYNDTIECFNNTSMFLKRWVPATTNDNDHDDDASVDNGGSAAPTFRGLDDLQRAVSVPLFTTSSPLDDSCRFAYPMVNYQMIADSIPSSSWLG
jgi:hypothetical protein